MAILLETGDETPLIANAVSALRDIIALPAFTQGTRLPSENELAARIGISRPVLRQALSVLKEEKIIESRRGSGTFKIATNSKPVTYGAPENLADLRECLRFRIVLESAAAALAAERCDAASIGEIRKTVEAMEGPKTKDITVLEVDMDFHLAVARAARSRYYVMTLEFLRPQKVRN